MTERAGWKDLQDPFRENENARLGKVQGNDEA